MPADGTATRATIMDMAEELVLHQGFAGTSVDSIIGEAGVTKGAFFHHFPSKQDLAHALIERFADRDQGHLFDKVHRAEKLQRDPLQQMLVFIGLFIEEAEIVTQPSPGCLMGSYVYEAGLFDDHTLKVIQDNMILWREELTRRFEKIAETHPPALDVDLRALADLMYVIIEGAFIMSRSLKEPETVADQLTHYRNYIELLFGGQA